MTPEKLYEARSLMKRNQTQLAKELGLFGGTISRWERGTQPIPSWMEAAVMGVAAGDVARATERADTRPEAPIAITARLLDAVAVLSDVARVIEVRDAVPA